MVDMKELKRIKRYIIEVLVGNTWKVFDKFEVEKGLEMTFHEKALVAAEKAHSVEGCKKVTIVQILD